MEKRTNNKGFGKRRRAVINRNSKPKPIQHKKALNLFRAAGRTVLSKTESGQVSEGTTEKPARDVLDLAEAALHSLSKHRSESNVWREDASKVYDGHEGRDQYWSMFRTGRRTDYGRRVHHGPDDQGPGHNRNQSLEMSEGSGEDEEDAPLSPRSAYMKKMEEFNLRPERIQFDKEKTELAIQSYGIGDKRMEALAQSLSHFPYEKVNISGNRMTDKGFEHVCRNLSDGCFVLDVSDNNLGPEGAKHVVHYILQPPPKRVQHELMTLSLASCKLGNAGAEILGEGLSSNKCLRRLLIANNDIEEDACMALTIGLMKCEALEELDISWNNIDLAAAALIRQLKTLQWLDISSNSLGSQSAQDQSEGFLSSEQAGDGSAGALSMMTRIATALAEHPNLIHVSLSNNQFELRQLKVLAKVLEANHTIIGLHLSHPRVCVDAHGFIQIDGASVTSDDPTEDGAADDVPAQDLHSEKVGIIGGAREAGDKLDSGHWTSLPPIRERREQFKHKSCWICGGYSEKSFKVVIRHDAADNLAQRASRYGVYLHLSIDGFRGEKMDAVKDGSSETETYSLYRMVPPGKLYGFFTVQEDAPAPTESDEHEEDSDAEPVTQSNSKVSFTFFTSEEAKKRAWTTWSHKAAIISLGLSENCAPGGGAPPEVNVWVIPKHSEGVLNNKSYPRVINGKAGNVFMPKTWSLKNSIFSKRAQESDCNGFLNKEMFLQRIMRTDWRFTKLGRWLPQRYKKSNVTAKHIFDAVQGAIAAHVGFLLQTFKFICAISSETDEDGFTFPKKPLLAALQAFEMGKKREVRIQKIHTTTGAMISKSDLDTMFMVVNLELESAGDSGESQAVAAMNDDNPDNALTRFEWFEFIVRLAAKRYKTVAHPSDDPTLHELSKKLDMDFVKPCHLEVVTIADAISALVNEISERTTSHPKAHLLLDDEEFANCDWFREKWLYLEKTDRVFKYCRAELIKLYNEVSGCEANGSAVFGPNMSIDEFMDCWLNRSKDIFPPRPTHHRKSSSRSSFGSRSFSMAESKQTGDALMQEIEDVMGGDESEGNNTDTSPAQAKPKTYLTPHHLRTDYLFSKMMSLTCYQTTRNENMTFPDFLEAAARVAFRIYPPQEIERPFDVSIARLLHNNFRYCGVVAPDTSNISKRAKKYLDVYDVPEGQRKLTTMDLLED